MAEWRGAALLLTATIEPRANLPEAGRLLLDPERRLELYVANLEHWLAGERWPGPVVFAESSGVGLEALRERFRRPIAERRLEIVYAGGDEFPGEYGKGYGESLILRRAFERAETLRRAPWVGKLTCLQRVANVKRLVARLSPGFRWVADLRDHGLYRLFGSGASGQWCDTRLFFVAPEFFVDHLARLYERHAGGHFYLETAYYEAMKRHLGKPGIHGRFPIEPDYRGAAGHWGKNYGSVGQRAKRLLRTAARQLFPGLWI